jgi:hypothetical protein
MLKALLPKIYGAPIRKWEKWDRFLLESTKPMEKKGEKGRKNYKPLQQQASKLFLWSWKMITDAQKLRTKQMLNIYMAQDCFLQTTEVVTNICLL